MVIDLKRRDSIRIRYYGVLPMTKRWYLALQAFVFTSLLGVLVVTLAWPEPRFGLDTARLSKAATWMLDHLLELTLITAALEVLDTVFTMRQFSRAEKMLYGSVSATSDHFRP